MTTTTVDAGPTPGKVYLVTLDDMGPDGKPYWYIDCEIGARAGMHFPDATTIVDPENGILTEADAKFIVHAWNSHADLVKALEVAVAHIEHMAAWITARNAGLSGQKTSTSLYSFEGLGEDMPDIRAALARVQP